MALATGSRYTATLGSPYGGAPGGTRANLAPKPVSGRPTGKTLTGAERNNSRARTAMHSLPRVSGGHGAFLLRTVAALCRAHLDPLANGGRRESESPRRPKKHGPCQRRCAGLVAQNPICHVCAAVPRHISVARAQRSAHLRRLKHFVGFRKHTEGKSPAPAIGLTPLPAVDKRIGCSIRQHWNQGRADARLSRVGVCRGPAGS